MKQLTIIRHAKSSWDFPGLPDFDRPLNKRGRRDAPAMARFTKSEGIIPDLILSSPANRTLTTARFFTAELNNKEESIHLNTTLYHATPDEIMVTLKTQRSDINHIMLFGHNPGVTNFCNLLGNLEITNIPTTGLVSLDLDINAWDQLQFGKAKLRIFQTPRELELTLS